MRANKLLYKSLLFLLTCGASTILGFLSFGGMFALWPILPLAFVSFVLSVAYEGEIYFQNIKNALKKLFKSHYLERQVANQFLLDHFPSASQLNDPSVPQFFRDYKAQLELLHAFGHDNLTPEKAAQKKKLEKTLKHMEKFFAKALFSDLSDANDPYVIELMRFIQCKNVQPYQQKVAEQQKIFSRVKWFSALSGAFMGVGTTYLLMEAFEVIPFFATLAPATLPFVIVPMAIIAGTAYGLLTYNTVTDFFQTGTWDKWKKKINIRGEAGQRITPYSVFMAATALALITLAVALTICTAGTWWTVVKETKPALQFLGRLPRFVMGIINPIITGLSALFFNLQNSSETLDLFENELNKPGHVFDRLKTAWRGFVDQIKQETWGQRINPFRIILLLVLPLRIILFLGHLVSIGVTADRVPGISQSVSALLGFVSEFFEDLHYFAGHSHQHAHAAGTANAHSDCGHDHAHDNHHADEHFKELLKERLSPAHSHSHDLDLPTRCLKFLFSPIYYFSPRWDAYFARKTPNADGNGLPLQIADIPTPSHTHKPAQPSQAWQKQHVLYRLDKYINKNQNPYFGQKIAAEKIKALKELSKDIKVTPDNEVHQRLAEENTPVYSKHRFGLFVGQHEKTQTQQFIDELTLGF